MGKERKRERKKTPNGKHIWPTVYKKSSSACTCFFYIWKQTKLTLCLCYEMKLIWAFNKNVQRLKQSFAAYADFFLYPFRYISLG